MYYGVDENGNIISSESSEILPEEYQEVFPEVAPMPETVSQGDTPEYYPLPDNFLDFMDSVSSGDLVGQFADQLPSTLSQDELIDLLAAIPGYSVFPNQTAVTVFTSVLNGLDKNVKYLIVSGSDTNYTYLYYGKNITLNGNVLVFNSPYTVCTYYQYRPSTSSAWQYLYTVSDRTSGSDTFTFNNTLVYTNIREGYPDVIPYKSRESYSFLFIIVLVACFVAFKTLTHRKGNSDV